ncbi:hypothetical protein D9M69_712380 [compost metagenome]
MREEELEQQGFPFREVDLLAFPMHFVQGRMVFKVAVTPDGLGLACHASRHGPEAGRQLVQGDGLDEVVVGARIQPRNTARDGFARCQDDNRHGAPGMAPAVE